MSHSNGTAWRSWVQTRLCPLSKHVRCTYHIADCSRLTYSIELFSVSLFSSWLCGSNYKQREKNEQIELVFVVRQRLRIYCAMSMRSRYDWILSYTLLSWERSTRMQMVGFIRLDLNNLNFKLIKTTLFAREHREWLAWYEYVPHWLVWAVQCDERFEIVSEYQIAFIWFSICSLAVWVPPSAPPQPLPSRWTYTFWNEMANALTHTAAQVPARLMPLLEFDKCHAVCAEHELSFKRNSNTITHRSTITDSSAAVPYHFTVSFQTT